MGRNHRFVGAAAKTSGVFGRVGARKHRTLGPGSVVKSVARPSFWRGYALLDPRIQQAARVAYRLFAENPDHPSLRFKKLKGYENVWSVRINDQFRAVGERNGDTIEWAWVGSHAEFDHRFG